MQQFYAAEGPSAEVVAPVSKQSSKSDETKRAREAVVNSKEEPKMEEGEVGASPPSSSHTPLVDSCPSKKVSDERSFYRYVSTIGK